MGERWCDVTTQTPDGQRHTITVESESVYRAAIHFFSRSRVPNPGEKLPKTIECTVFEVRPIYRVTQKQLMGWANKEAEASNKAGKRGGRNSYSSSRE
jgi:hypothetical protein